MVWGAQMLSMYEALKFAMVVLPLSMDWSLSNYHMYLNSLEFGMKTGTGL